MGQHDDMYAYTRWDNMMTCLEDGRLLWDNNLAENVIRPITLGRKNYLFCGNHEAAVNMSVRDCYKGKQRQI